MALSSPFCNQIPLHAISSSSSSPSSRKRLQCLDFFNYNSNALLKWATHRPFSAATAPPPRTRIQCFSRRKFQSDECF
ncbi:hypothetical protein FNV43_RR04541 [Rhamnella rubrinervis]|uniref:Uncharacterized protein n=1 Tax=Rhamnella rubrinervis TaxID=2594499 RepID=A0A8K0HM51_9ROSA|nr:hypothetical protein FNV43_RR04541 [Rhamnella rubrinervis]